MAAKNDRHAKKMTLEKVYSFVCEHDEPVVTAKDVAEKFDVTPKAAHYRLKQLEEQGEIASKVVGASAKVYYPVGR